MTALFSQPQVNGIIMWGFWAGQHWRPNAALFRQDWSLKPNGLAWSNLVFKEWWTTTSVVADANGLVTVRGFKGDYAHRGQRFRHDQSLQPDARRKQGHHRHRTRTAFGRHGRIDCRRPAHAGLDGLPSAGYRVETVDSLMPPLNWQPVADPPTLLEGIWRVAEGAAGRTLLPAEAPGNPGEGYTAGRQGVVLVAAGDFPVTAVAARSLHRRDQITPAEEPCPGDKPLPLALALLAGFAALTALAAEKDDIKTAIKSLAEKPNYTWTSETEGSPFPMSPLVGRAEQARLHRGQPGNERRHAAGRAQGHQRCGQARQRVEDGGRAARAEFWRRRTA
jgi:hypothetical protein